MSNVLCDRLQDGNSIDYTPTSDDGSLFVLINPATTTD